MLPKERENINFLQNVTVDDLSRWFLDGKGLEPVWYNDDESGAVRLAGTYKNVDTKIQEKISHTLVKSVADWSPSVHKISALADVAIIAALIQNEKVVPGLVKIIEEKVVLPTKTIEDDHDFSVIVSCIVGSATKEAKEAITKWYENDIFDWKFSGMFCVGLVSYNPQDARKILPKLLRTMDEHPDYFVPGYLASGMCTYTGPDELEKILKNFENESAKVLLAEMPVAREIYEESKEE